MNVRVKYNEWLQDDICYQNIFQFLIRPFKSRSEQFNKKKEVIGIEKTYSTSKKFSCFVPQIGQTSGMLERVLGMALPHSIEWIQLYQMFNEGPSLVEQKKGRNINYVVKTKEKQKSLILMTL